MYNPINRTTVQIDENKYRKYPKNGPLFYKNSNGDLNDIDLTFNDTTSSIGEISLMDKGVVSVGKRKDKNPYKITGIRPDNCQTGEKQLEFSVVNIELDDQVQEFDDLELILSPSQVFQLIKLNGSFSKCKIELDIHAKGFTLQNSKYTEATKIADYGFNLNNIGQNTGNATIGIHNEYESLNKDIPYLDFTVGQINDQYITMGGYSRSEEFGDADLTNYNINEDLYTHGAAVYYHNTIVFTAHAYNIPDYQSIMLNNLCNLYGLEVFDDGGHGKYLTKDNKKVIGYYVKDNTFVGFINTEAIPENIKDLFIRKSFQDTSFLDLTLSDFCSDMTNTFNKDLAINVDQNYYKGNSFDFKLNNESIYINKPIAFDKDFNNLYYQTEHTLKQNEDGSYRYTKYLLPETALNINDAAYLDATLSAASEASQLNYMIPLSTDSNLVFWFSTGLKKTSTNFTTMRDATASPSNSANAGLGIAGVNSGFNYIGDYGSVRPDGGQFAQTYKYAYSIHKAYFNFDCEDITDTISDMDFKMTALFSSLYTTGNSGGIADHSVILLKGDVGSNTGADRWNDFAGHTTGWDADDVTEYSDEFVISDTSFGNRTIPMTSDAKTDLKNLDKLEIFIIDYDQYYNDSLNASWAYRPQGSFTNNNIRNEYRQTRMYHAEASTTSYRPYIEYEVDSTPAPSAPAGNAGFFGANF